MAPIESANLFLITPGFYFKIVQGYRELQFQGDGSQNLMFTVTALTKAVIQATDIINTSYFLGMARSFGRTQHSHLSEPRSLSVLAVRVATSATLSSWVMDSQGQRLSDPRGREQKGMSYFMREARDHPSNEEERHG